MYKIQCSYSNTNIDIELCERISVLSEDSGIGKTFVVNGINEALRVKEYGSIKATKNGEDIAITIINGEDDNINTIKNAKDLVIIDEADELLAENNGLIDEIQNNKNADFLLIMRGMFNGMYFSQRQYLSFEFTGKSINIKPVKRGLHEFFKGDDSGLHIM